MAIHGQRTIPSTLLPLNRIPTPDAAYPCSRSRLTDPHRHLSAPSPPSRWPISTRSTCTCLTRMARSPGPGWGDARVMICSKRLRVSDSRKKRPNGYSSKSVSSFETRLQPVLTNSVSGVSYLHGRGIYHRDLKDENIVIDRYLNVSLANIQSSD